MSVESKVRIYKTSVRPVLTYAAETRADTTKTRQKVNTTEMKILRTIAGKTLYDRIRNSEVRKTCNIQDVRKFTNDRRKYWNKHINRMHEYRLPFRVIQEIPKDGKRERGRPPKRWKECWTSHSEDG